VDVRPRAPRTCEWRGCAIEVPRGQGLCYWHEKRHAEREEAEEFAKQRRVTICPSCGAHFDMLSLEDWDPYCPGCNGELEEILTAPSVGWSICPSCGAGFRGEDVPCPACGSCRVCGSTRAWCKGRCQACYRYWVRHGRAEDRSDVLVNRLDFRTASKKAGYSA